MTKETRKCVVCGKKFTPKVANQLTCSDKCKKINKAKHDKVRKAKLCKEKKPVAPAVKKVACAKGGKKPVAKAVSGKAVEKIVLPKKPTAKKLPKNPNVDTIISVKNGNPFKVFFLATLVRERAKREILKNGLMYQK
jgi:predicted nucleic acid-binding Zn ribbon protein